MRKSIIRSLCLAVIAAGSMVPAHAAPAMQYGATQYKSVPRTNRYTKSEAYWESKGNARQLHLKCLKESLPNDSQWNERIARAAMVVDFTKDSPRGAQVNHIMFKYQPQAAGVIFTSTTHPVIRVEYLKGSDTLMKTVPVKSHGYDAQNFVKVEYEIRDLKSLGLDPEEVRILRFAIVALPKENKHVDDYANIVIKDFDYLPKGSTKWVIPDEDLKIRDGSTDHLINGN